MTRPKTDLFSNKQVTVYKCIIELTIESHLTDLFNYIDYKTSY